MILSGGIAGLLVFALFMMFNSVGVAGLACMVGNRLRDMENDEKCHARSIMRGGIVLELSFVFPLVGWFFLLPVALIIGTGATTRLLLSKRATQPAAPLVVPEKPAEQKLGASS